MTDTSYNDRSFIEEVELDEIPEQIRRQFAHFDFPVITYRGGPAMYVNLKAADLFPWDYVHIYTTSQYVVFTPARTGSADAFRVTPMTHGISKMIRVPAALREKRIKKGAHRLYRYKDGLCFKRYETIREEEVESLD